MAFVRSSRAGGIVKRTCTRLTRGNHAETGGRVNIFVHLPRTLAKNTAGPSQFLPEGWRAFRSTAQQRLDGLS